MSITFTAAYGAGLSYWIYGLQSLSLWLHNGNTKGFLLAETDSSRMLEAGFDSRDENYYLIDIWNYSEQRNY